MIYNFICTLKGVDFKYKVEADNITEAKIKIRDYIKNSVHIEEVVKEPKDFLNFFNEMINK